MDVIVDVASIAAAIVVICSFIFSAYKFNKSLNAQVFTNYTKRYDQIMEQLPDNFRVNSETGIDNISEEDRKNMVRYLNLCSEEYFLKENGYLDEEIWETWEGEFKRYLNNTPLGDEWKNIREEFDAYSDFQEFVDDINEKYES